MMTSCPMALRRGISRAVCCPYPVGTHGAFEWMRTFIGCTAPQCSRSCPGCSPWPRCGPPWRFALWPRWRSNNPWQPRHCWSRPAPGPLSNAGLRRQRPRPWRCSPPVRGPGARPLLPCLGLLLQYLDAVNQPLEVLPNGSLEVLPVALQLGEPVFMDALLQCLQSLLSRQLYEDTVFGPDLHGLLLAHARIYGPLQTEARDVLGVYRPA